MDRNPGSRSKAAENGKHIASLHFSVVTRAWSKTRVCHKAFLKSAPFAIYGEEAFLHDSSICCPSAFLLVITINFHIFHVFIFCAVMGILMKVEWHCMMEAAGHTIFWTSAIFYLQWSDKVEDRITTFQGVHLSRIRPSLHIEPQYRCNNKGTRYKPGNSSPL